MNKPDDQQWLAWIGQQLDAECSQLDAKTVSQLNRARQAALEQLDRPSAWKFFESHFGLVAGLAGGAAALALAVILWTASPLVNNGLDSEDDIELDNLIASQTDLGDGELMDLALLATDDSFEFYENLEFYDWLETELDQG